jgi:hypothetical protein
MASKHGTANRYNHGCRCNVCKKSHARRAADYRQRLLSGEGANRYHGSDSPAIANATPGPVQSAVKAEIAQSSQAHERPALAASFPWSGP